MTAASGHDPLEHPSPATIGDRLARARGRRFVGRASELELFRAALAAPEPPFAVLFVHGPGGVGKTALLHALGAAARERGLEPLRLDLRDFGGSPPAVAEAIRAAAGGHAASSPAGALSSAPRRVLLLDTYEAAGPIDGWLRDELLPHLPAHVPVVIAGRSPPGPEWQADAGWQEMLRTVALRNLHPDDARAYLLTHGVPEAMHEHAIALTYGHPLALALLTDLVGQRQGDWGAEAPAQLLDAPDAVRALVQRFADDAPSPLHRRALEVCAHARVTTEDLLAAAVDPDSGGELFAWLCELSFVELGSEGAFPHDLVRDVLDADLRWRAPDRYLEQHRRIRRHVVARARAASGHRGQSEVASLLFLHRNNTRFSAFVDWSAFAGAYVDTPRDGDADALVALARHHEGETSAALVARWLERQPGAFFVFRGKGREVLGFAAILALHEASPEDIAADAGTAAMAAYSLRHGPARPGEEVYAARFLIDRDVHQGVSPSLNLVMLAQTQHILARPRRAWDFIGPWTDPDWAAPLMRHIDFHRAPDADYEVDGRRYGVFAHDWRRTDVEAWLELTATRELADGDADAPPPDASPPLLALSHGEFVAATRRALRDLHRRDALAANPLMRSRALRDRAGEQPPSEALRDLLAEAVDTLRVDPRDEKLHRALARTYVRPAPTQELAAEALGLPFSTYRRHVARGLERVVGWLWQLELYGPEDRG